MKKRFYLTTTLPYVNAEPHIGFALELVQADIVARYHRDVLDEEVFFNTGTDEHGVKIYRKALEEGKDPQVYVDEYAEKFKKLIPELGISEDTHFIRTTDEKHLKAVEAFWRACDKNGFIEKRSYKVKYCVGCELEKTDSELVYGHCELHPKLPIEFIEEENYFFKFSAFKDRLLKLYADNPDFVVPRSRGNEIHAFIERGPEDFSISRLKEKMPWGVSVPDDDTQVIYVWFDALVNYVSTLGWPDNEENFKKFWGTDETPNAIQMAGKDNLRQQSAMWQAMLMGAGLPPSKQIVIHGFIQSGGEKMSKSAGNVINPLEIVAEYGTDALRYYLARHVHPFEDSDFTMEKFKEAYNADLANGLGNLVSRVMKMAVSYGVKIEGVPKVKHEEENKFKELLDVYNIAEALSQVEKLIGLADAYIQSEEPFKKIKTEPERAKEIISESLADIFRIATMLRSFLPETSKKILEIIEENKMPATPLFPRKD